MTKAQIAILAEITEGLKAQVPDRDTVVALMQIAPSLLAERAKMIEALKAAKSHIAELRESLDSSLWAVLAAAEGQE